MRTLLIFVIFAGGCILPLAPYDVEAMAGEYLKGVVDGLQNQSEHQFRVGFSDTPPPPGAVLDFTDDGSGATFANAASQLASVPSQF